MLGTDMTTQLTPGDPAVLGDGAVVQIGYFTASTTENLFAGSFVPLTGEAGANSGFSYTSIGDDPAAIGDPMLTPGYFFDIYRFIVGDSAVGQNLPSAGTFLAIRFYNGTTIADSTHFNTVSSTDSEWQWVTPYGALDPASPLQLSDFATLVWQDADGAGATTIVIPEPAAYAALFGLAVLGLAASRRRRS